MTKICKKCNIEKNITHFFNDKSKKDFHRNSCKECENKIASEYRKCNKEKIQKYYLENREKRKNYNKEYWAENKEILKISNLEYYYENSDKILEQSKKYYLDNREKKIEYQREYYLNNSEKRKEYWKNYQKNNRSKINEYLKNIKKDPLIKLKYSIRTLISQSFKFRYTKKAKKTIEILGCTFEEFKIHIESKFTSEMNWDNYAIYWQLDHIIPMSWANSEKEVYELNTYTNFQPLEWIENIKKSNKFSG